MSDDQFAFLKTGFGGTESNSTSDDAYNTFVTGAQNILLLFAEDAMRTAGRYVQATGRRNVTKRDMKMALQYEAVHFFEKDGLEERMAQLINEDGEEDEEEDGEDDDGEEGGEEGEEDEEDDEEYEDDGEEDEDNEEEEKEDIPQEDVEFCNRIRCIASTWDDWHPEDEAQQLVKRAINAIP